MRGAGKGMETIRTNIVTKAEKHMSVLLSHDVLHSCKNNVTSGETQAPHITRCCMLLLQTHAETHRHKFLPRVSAEMWI